MLARHFLQDIFAGKNLLEIACGTGYWTEILAKTAHSIFATDINDSVLEVAKSKNYYPATVRFEKGDLFHLPDMDEFEGLFGGFIWSHIKLQELGTFISITNQQVKKGGVVVFMDNNYVEGSNLPICERDDFGNTYQIRTLEDGTTHKVVKNFPTEYFIRQNLEEKAEELNFVNLQYYWIVSYRVL